MTASDRRRRYYVVWFQLSPEHGYLLWYSDDEDGVWTDDGAVSVWRSESAARAFAIGRGLDLDGKEPVKYDLDQLESDRASADLLNDCWNLFSDIAESIDGGDGFKALDEQSGDVYDRIFRNTATARRFDLSGDVDELSDEDLSRARVVLHAGREMFRGSMRYVEEP